MTEHDNREAVLAIVRAGYQPVKVKKQWAGVRRDPEGGYEARFFNSVDADGIVWWHDLVQAATKKMAIKKLEECV